MPKSKQNADFIGTISELLFPQKEQKKSKKGGASKKRINSFSKLADSAGLKGYDKFTKSQKNSKAKKGGKGEISLLDRLSTMIADFDKAGRLNKKNSETLNRFKSTFETELSNINVPVKSLPRDILNAVNSKFQGLENKTGSFVQNEMKGFRNNVANLSEKLNSTEKKLVERFVKALREIDVNRNNSVTQAKNVIKKLRNINNGNSGNKTRSNANIFDDTESVNKENEENESDENIEGVGAVEGEEINLSLNKNNRGNKSNGNNNNRGNKSNGNNNNRGNKSNGNNNNETEEEMEGGGFLESASELLAPAGWGDFVTAAGLTALSKAVPAKKPSLNKERQKSNKKGGASKQNPWMKHVAKYRAKHPNMSYKQCLQNAKKSYKK